jgi:hypothetical protein
LHGTRASLRPGRPRLVAYCLILGAVLGGLVLLARGTSRPEVTLLRGTGVPFEVAGSRVQNQIRVKISNRTEQPGLYHLELSGVAGAELVAPENPLPVSAGEQNTTSVFVIVPLDSIVDGSRTVTLGVSDGHGFDTQLPYRILGPLKACS